MDGRKRRGNLFVISGPSGAGKGTLVQKVLARDPALWLSVSATTRAPRPGEVDGVSYLFRTDEEFDELIAEDGLLEWAEVHGNRYGTPRAPVVEHVEAGDQVILEIEPQGAFQVKAAYPDAILIFIAPPSFEELERRLVHRATETPEQIRRRLQTAVVEMGREKEYDVVVCNDDVDEATDRLLAFMVSRGA